MPKQADLQVKVSADTKELGRGLDDAKKKVQSFGKSMSKNLKNIGKQFTTVGKTFTAVLTVPLIAVGTAAFKASEEVDKAFDIIRLGTGATGDALKSLENDFKSVFRSVPNSAEEVGTAIADLNTRTGLTGKALQNLARQELLLSRITKTDVAATIASTTRLFGDWDVTTERQSEALNLLLKTSQATGIKVGALADKMVQFGAPLRQMGFDMETSAVLMGKWEKEGVNAELVLGSLRIALGKMAKEGVQDTSQALRIMIERIKAAGSTGRANALAMEMFGARAGPDMAAAIREGRFEIDELIKAVKGSNETVEQAYLDTASWSEAMGELRNMATSALAPLGRSLTKAMLKLRPQFEKVIDSVSKLIERFTSLSPETQGTILKVVALAMAIGPLLLGVGKLFTTWGKLIPILGKAGLIIGKLTVPVWGVWAAIAALIGVLGYLAIKNETVRKALITIWNNIKQKIQAALNTIEGLLQFIIALISGDWKAAWDGLKKAAVGALEFIFGPIDKLIGKVKDAIDWVKRLFGLDGKKGGGKTVSLGVQMEDRTSFQQFHSGGIFRAPRIGGEGLALLKDNEGVFTPSQMRALALGAGGGSRTLRLEGGFTVRGVNDRGELIAIAKMAAREAVMDDLRRGARRQ